MLVKTNSRIINLDKVAEIVKDDSNLILIFYIDENRASVKFEDESMLDKAFNGITSGYFYGHSFCDITEYVKKGE